jgi:hypothetical protein
LGPSSAPILEKKRKKTKLNFNSKFGVELKFNSILGEKIAKF